MSAVWITVIVLGALTVLLKSAGPVLVGGRELPPVVLRVLSLLAPALLAAFVAVSVFDARRPGARARRPRDRHRRGRRRACSSARR